MKTITVTGTPATGKTTVAKMLTQKARFVYFDVNNVIKENGLDSEFDEERDCAVIDTDKLMILLNNIITDAEKEGAAGIVIDSHLSHYLPPDLINLVIVTSCDISVLKKRLEKRGYNEEKVRENLDSEILDICFVEAKEKGHDVVKIDTTEGTSDEELDSILSTVE